MIEGLPAKKIGMTQVFKEDGEVVPVSVVEVLPCTVLEIVQVNNKKKIKVGFEEEKRDSKMKKPQKGYFDKLKMPYFRRIKEFTIDEGDDYKQGDVLDVKVFKDVKFVDVQGKTKGRGFSGGMKRWNWSGQPASHGSTIHRKMGSAGPTTDPGRIIKGHHMPGHYGCETVTIQNLEVVRVDEDKNLLLIKGAIPGARNSLVFVKKAKKK